MADGEDDLLARIAQGGNPNVDAADFTLYAAHQDSTMSGAILATPHQASVGFIAPSGSLSRPITRSMSRLMASDDVVNKFPRTSALERLQKVTLKAANASSSTRLEDAEDIDYEEANEDNQQDEEEEGDRDEIATEAANGDRPSLKRKATYRAPSVRPETSQLRPVRRSARISARTPSRSAPTARRRSSSISAEPPRKRRKKTDRKQKSQLGVRRSTRIAKPATEFQEYDNLPPELKILVWEKAIEPRVVYIRNRSAPSYSYDVQNKDPSLWFRTCQISFAVSKQAYKPVFALRNPDDTQLDARTRQYVNPGIDIVMLEPCCSGCRGYHCARTQFTDADRASVRLLAVQIDSPWLAPTARPCWETISASWENVETLYLVRAAIRGDHKDDKAIIRVKEDDREKELRKRFDDWKKAEGKDRKLTTLEFVIAVNKETEPQSREQRYKGVQDRATGMVEDVILG